MTPALHIDDLSVRLNGSATARPILDRVTLTVGSAETVGLVGESGSGKSVTSRAALGMLPAGATVSGRVLVGGEDVLTLDRKRLRRLRGGRAAMVFQDPRSGINPVRRVRDFLIEGLLASGSDRATALSRCAALLDSVGIRDSATVLGQFPHQLSGGMLQRIMIAAALAGEPALLLADEPTTALDVTTQAEVISLLDERRARLDAAMLFVTHDLELAAAICDRIYVLYAGRVVEEQRTADLFAAPRHPYTRALLASTPRLESDEPVRPITGRPLSLAESAPGCPFAARCPHREDRCDTEPPPLRRLGDAEVACVRAEELSSV